MIKKALRKAYNTVYDNIGNYIVRKNYRIRSGHQEENVVKKILRFDFIKNMDFFDETNALIRKMFNIKSSPISNIEKYSINGNNEIVVKSHQDNCENWNVFLSDAVEPPYAIEFDYCQNNTYCEFQVAFNYESLLNRNRFIVMENKDILFDDISNGHFFKPFSILGGDNSVFRNGEINHIEVLVTDNYFELFVNHKSLMCIEVKHRLHKHNRIAIVLWENYKNRPIDVKISNLALSRISSDENPSTIR